MGQLLHGSAKTTHAIRKAIQRSTASIAELAEKYDLNPKTVMKWRARDSVEDRKTGPKDPRSTVLSADEEAPCIAFRKHSLLPLDDCLYALQATIPRLTRSSLHRLFQRHDISRLPSVDGDKPKKVNCTCSLPLIVQANLLLQSCTKKPRALSRKPSLKT